VFFAATLATVVLVAVLPASASESSGAAAWGLNNDSQLGNGTITTEKEAVAVKVLTEATAVAGGELDSLALLKTGKVMAWGENNDGQLGNGTTTTEKEPVEVKGISEAVAIAAGADHSLALLKSGKVMAWGLNNDGQLGNGTTTTEKEPVEVKRITEAVAIAAGSDHSLAVLKDGKVMAWGDNNDGQLGNGTTTTEKEPVEVKGITAAVAVAGGEFHSLALLSSGKVEAWGENNDGQLGNGTTTTEKEPVEVKEITEGVAVAAGHSHSLAVLKSGKTMAWGDNNDGQLGNGTTTTEKEPVEVKGITAAVAVASGEFHSLALLSSGKIDAWGENNDSQLGNGTTTTEKEPVEVKGLSGAAGGISAGANFSLASYATKPADTVLPAVSGEAKDEETLTVSTGTWTGTPTITYSYQWESCNTAGESCASIFGATGSTYVIAHELVGHTVRVKVTGKNAAGEAAASSAQTATVVGSAPANTVLPVVSGEAKDEKTLTASTGTWAGTPTIIYTYQWESCNTAGEACASISGATSATYVIAHELVGHTIRVSVTAKNAAGEAAASSAQTVTVVGSAPANTVLPVVSGEAKDEKTLSASTGTWVGTPTITYSYQWASCNTGGESCASISGATGSTYTVGHELVGHTIRVKVTGKNAAGEAAASSAQTATVVASAPANTVLPTISGTAKEGRTLSASTGSWSGTPPITFSYQWESCNASGGSCSNISGATGSTHLLGAGEAGKTMRVVVTANNTVGPTASTSEATGVIAESPCTDTWTGPHEGVWETAGDWSTGSVPGPTDVACIEEGAIVEVTNSNYEVGAVEAASASLKITGAQLEIAGQKVSTVRTLTLEEGSLKGAGELDVSESLTSTGFSYLSGSGSTVIEPAAIGTVSQGRLGLEGRTLSNAGSITVEGSGGIQGDRGSHLVNSGTLIVNGELPGGSESALTNTGLLEKTEGSGVSQIGFPIENEATVKAQTGTLELRDGGSSGAISPDSWLATGTGAIVFNASQGTPFSLGATAPMSGAIELEEGDVSVGTIEGKTATVSMREGFLEVTNASDPSTVAGLDLEGGTLRGAGELDVSESFSASGFAYMSGTGPTVIEQSATGSVAHGRMGLEGRTLRNAGQLTIGTEGGLLASKHAGLLNSGTLIVNAERPAGNYGLIASEEDASLTNTGVIEKTQGSGLSSVQYAIDNEGTVRVESGELEFSGGGKSGISSPGSWLATGAGTSIAFNDASNVPFSLGTTVPMSGSILDDGVVSAGTIEGAGANVATDGDGSLELTNPSRASAVAGLEIEGGSLKGAGSIDVASSFVAGGDGDLGGTGSTVIEPGASGSIAKERVALEERTLDNEGTLTLSHEGTIDGGHDGHLVNSGTLLVNAQAPYGNAGLLASNEEATLTNTGTMKKTEGAGVGRIGFSIDNEASVTAEAGTLEFSGGGSSGQFATDTWTAAPGATIAFNNFPSASYALGEHVALSGRIAHEASISAGQIEGQSAELVTTLGNLTLTSMTPSILKSLILDEPPYSSIYNEGAITVPSELDIISQLTWSSGTTYFLGPGKIVAGPGSTTVFDPPAWINLRGGKFVNEGVATWKSGGFDTTSDTGKLVPGNFFENYGTFNIEQDASNPVVYGCTQEGCPTFVNYGATHPEALSQIGWRTNIIDYATTGHFEPNYEEKPECLDTEVDGGPSPEAEECARRNAEFQGVMIEEHATIEQAPWYRGGLEIAGTPEQYQELFTRVGSWRAKPAPAFTYQWERCGGEEAGEVLGGDCVKIEGATSRTYVPQEADVGHTLRVVVTGANHLNHETQISPATAVILPLPTIEGEAEEGQTVTLSMAAWASTTPRSVRYQWMRCGGEEEGEVLGEDCYDIAGATSPELELTGEDVGHTVRVAASVNMPAGSFVAESEATAVVWAREGGEDPEPTRVAEEAELRELEELEEIGPGSDAVRLSRTADSAEEAASSSQKKCSETFGEWEGSGGSDHCYAELSSPFSYPDEAEAFGGVSALVGPNCMKWSGHGLVNNEVWATIQPEPIATGYGWMEAGAHVGDSYRRVGEEIFTDITTRPEYFGAFGLAEVKPPHNFEFYEINRAHHVVPMNEYFKDEVWHVKGTAAEWEFWTPGEHAKLKLPAEEGGEPGVATQLMAGAEDDGEANATHGYLGEVLHLPREEGKWLPGIGSSDAEEALVAKGPHTKILYTHAPTSAVYSFNSCK
jgi:alpha-tubulin suppressor-like RCC1 family protein